jgi:DNA-directed RNA polymerase subunit M/transcription elongation factor TFIIS
MLIPNPATLYTATAKGSVTKDVTCERCGHTYSYRMSRTVTGRHKVPFSSSRGPEKASNKARADLAKALETDHDDVPCPECGWHQPAHITSVRRRLYPGLNNVAGAFFYLASLALGVVVFFLALFTLVLPEHTLPKASSQLQMGLFVLAVASPGLLLRGVRSLLALNYRPNR